MTVDKMRCKIAEVYKGPLWRLKVQEMSNRQVIAVYKDMEKRGAFEPKRTPKIKLDSEPECIQLTIWDFMKPDK